MGFPNKDSQFKKGQSGNPKGRPKKQCIKQVIEAMFEAEIEIKGVKYTHLEAATKTMVMKAIKGDVKAFEMLTNRLFGKPAQMQPEQDDNQEAPPIHIEIISAAPPKTYEPPIDDEN